LVEISADNIEGNNDNNQPACKISQNNSYDFIKLIYDKNLGMLSLADAKARLTLTVQSLLLTIGIGSSLLADIPAELENLTSLRFSFYLAFFGLLILTTFVGVFYSIKVFVDRSNPHISDTIQKKSIINWFIKHMKRKEKKRIDDLLKKKPRKHSCQCLIYYKEIRAEYQYTDEYIDKLIELTCGTKTIELVELASQIYNIAYVLEIKFAYVKLAKRFLFTNLVFSVFLLIINGIILL
jgi:hypothetical protein